MKSDVSGIGTGETLPNTSTSHYTCKCLWDTGAITTVIQQLHHLGHGIHRGMDPAVHYWRILGQVLGKQHLLGVFDSTGTAVGAVSYYPEAVEDSHYVETVFYTDFFVVEPGHPDVARLMMQELRRLARSFGAGRLAISRGESCNTYRTTYYKVGTA